MRRNDNTKKIDRRIEAMLHNESAPLPTDEWFIDKTLNRLPARNRRTIGIPEILAFLIVVATSAIVTIRELQTVLNMPDLYDFNPALLLSASAMALLATLYISIPLLRNA